jgi:hypothetical protein
LGPLLAVPATQLGSTFKWLLSYGVTSERIASAFGLTAVNVRVIASRVQSRSAATQEDVHPVHLVPIAVEKVRLGIRSELEESVEGGERSLETIRQILRETADASQTEYEFARGSAALKQLLPMIGYPSDSRRVDLLGQLHFRIGWFNCHLGNSSAAISHAESAMDLFRTAFHESGDRSAVDRYVLAGLVRSQSLLLSQRPEEAVALLDLIAEAAHSVGSPLGSDHFRQRGVAMLQMFEDEAAAKHFVESSRKMEALGEAKSMAQLAMTGRRHLHLLGSPNCDGMMEIRHQAVETFGPDSLESSMTTNWAAAAAFSTNSSSLEGQALDLIQQNAATAARFGHQKTVSAILSTIPQLGLYPHLQKKFVRHALYENAYRRR